MKKEKDNKNQAQNVELPEETIISMLEDGNQITEDMQGKLSLDEVNRLVDTLIPRSIIEQAEREEKESKKPETGFKRLLVRLIYNRAKDPATTREKLISKAAGMVGHLWAARYFKDEGYDVENEVNLSDKQGKLLTASDIILTSSDGTKRYIEVKTIKALISDPKDYPYGTLSEGQPIPRELYADLDRGSIIDFAVETGAKAQSQVSRTRKYLDEKGDKSSSVSLCVFEGCKISDDVRKGVEESADIIVLPLHIDKIFEYCSLLVDTVLYKGRNILNPVRGVPERHVDIPDLDI